jgi:hypothetical protein
VADNRDEFYNLLDRWVQNCALKLYSSIFGSAAMQNLSDVQKQFLMLQG